MKKETVSWVVYLMTIHKRTEKIRAVCEQSEWDAMESARPGYHHLIRGGIATEVEAELLARSQPASEPAAATEDFARRLGSVIPSPGIRIRKQGDLT